jgi:hypothetical protein
MLLLRPEELSPWGDYQPDLHDVAIAAGITCMTSEQVGPLRDGPNA